MEWVSFKREKANIFYFLVVVFVPWSAEYAEHSHIYSHTHTYTHMQYAHNSVWQLGSSEMVDLDWVPGLKTCSSNHLHTKSEIVTSTVREIREKRFLEKLFKLLFPATQHCKLYSLQSIFSLFWRKEGRKKWSGERRQTEHQSWRHLFPDPRHSFTGGRVHLSGN